MNLRDASIASQLKIDRVENGRLCRPLLVAGSISCTVQSAVKVVRLLAFWGFQVYFVEI